MARLIDAFGRRLRALRKAKRMTLEQLGHAAGIGFKHVSEVERGVKAPSFDALERLARALKVQPYELFLPEHLVGDDEGDQNLRLLIREIERHGSPRLKRFLTGVLAAAQGLENDRQ